MNAGKRSSGPCVAKSSFFRNNSSAETPKSSRSGSTEPERTKKRDGGYGRGFPVRPKRCIARSVPQPTSLRGKSFAA